MAGKKLKDITMLSSAISDLGKIDMPLRKVIGEHGWPLGSALDMAP